MDSMWSSVCCYVIAPSCCKLYCYVSGYLREGCRLCNLLFSVLFLKVPLYLRELRVSLQCINYFCIAILDVEEICALLGNYAAYSGNSLPTFQDNLWVPFSGFHDTLHCLQKERRFHSWWRPEIMHPKYKMAELQPCKSFLCPHHEGIEGSRGIALLILHSALDGV